MKIRIWKVLVGCVLVGFTATLAEGVIVKAESTADFSGGEEAENLWFYGDFNGIFEPSNEQRGTNFDSSAIVPGIWNFGWKIPPFTLLSADSGHHSVSPSGHPDGTVLPVESDIDGDSISSSREKIPAIFTNGLIVLADSVTDFSGVQGQNNWFYGY